MDNHHRSMKICKQTKNNFTKLICAKRDFAFWNAIQTLTWVYPAIILFIVKLIGHWIWCTRSRPVSFFYQLGKILFYPNRSAMDQVTQERVVWHFSRVKFKIKLFRQSKNWRGPFQTSHTLNEVTLIITSSTNSFLAYREFEIMNLVNHRNVSGSFKLFWILKIKDYQIAERIHSTN